MKAVILAAGVGKRLKPFTDEHPKSLLSFEGRSLIQHHLEALGAAGIEEATVVVGYREEQIRAEVERIHPALPVRFVSNPRYTAGSAISLLSAAEVFSTASSIVMDADLLYSPELIRRLISAPEADCLLVDGRFEDSGEEVKAVVRGNRVWELGKTVNGDGVIAGESVGIFKFSAQTGARLAAMLEKAIEQDASVEYELVLNDLFKEREAGHVRVDDLPWIEIDFWKDVERARTEILPQLTGTCR